MTDNNYPDWQKAIREAQAEQKQLDARMELEVAAARAKRQALKDAYYAGLLKWALDKLGVPVETPAPKVALGKFEFYIIRLFSNVAEWDEDMAEKRFVLEGADRVEIELGISRLPELTPEEAEFEEYLNFSPTFRSLTVSFPCTAQHLTLYRARLADTLDALEAGFAVFRQDVDTLCEKRRRAAATPAPAPRIETPEERLVAALTAFIRSKADDLSLENVSADDFGY